MGWLKAYVKQYSWQFVCGSGGKFLEALFEILVPTFVAAMIDNGVSRRNETVIWQYGGLILGLSLLGFALAIYAQYQAAIASQGTGTAIRKRIWQYIQKLSLEERAAFEQSEVMTALTSDSEQIQLAIAMSIRLLLRAPFIVLGATVLAGFLAPQFLWLFLFITAAMTVLLWVTLHLMLPLYKENQGLLARISRHVADIGGGLRFVRGFRAFGRERKKAEGLYTETFVLANRISHLNALLSPLSLLILNGSIIGLLYLGGLSIHAGNLSSGTLIALVNYMYQISAAVLVVSNVAGILSRGAASGRRLAIYFETKTIAEPEAEALNTAKTGFPADVLAKRESTEAKSQTAPDESLVISNLTYYYPNASLPSLEDISLTIPCGEALGIIGRTGSGKSTLAQVLAGLRQSSAGQVELFGRRLSEIRQSEHVIGFVSQKAAILKGSIRENMLLADAYSDTDMIAALEAADAWEFVKRYPDGLDHPIVEEGKNLSGGQKQRLALARALLRKPACLILDDTFSALDQRTIELVRRSLGQWPGLQLMIMVSQKVDHIRHLNNIAVLADGQLQGFGSHEHLLAENELYREICASQEIGSAGGDHE